MMKIFKSTNKWKMECLILSDSDDDEEESQGRDYVPTSDAYMAGIRNNIAEQLWRTVDRLFVVVIFFQTILVLWFLSF